MTIDVNKKTTKDSEYIQPGEIMLYQKKKPVSLSLTECQIGELDTRAAQTGLNRSTQIQRDLNAYWFMLRDGLKRLQTMLTVEDARYVANIFRGRALASCEDAIWSDEYLSTYVRKSGLYGDSTRATHIADVLDAAGTLARFSLMDWVRRVAFNARDERLFECWQNETNVCDLQ